MKVFFTSCLIALSFSAHASLNLECSFTEPFFDVRVDMGNKKIVMVAPDWNDLSDGPLRYIETDLSDETELKRSLRNGHLTIEGVNKTSGETTFSAVLDFMGSDGMSDYEFAFDARFQGNWGGCTTPSLRRVDPSFINIVQMPFYEDMKKAIALCYNRAISNWTSIGSLYNRNQSVFSILYQSDYVPGEPGGVSSTFSSHEGHMLGLLVEETKAVPASSESRIKFCDLYGQLLLERFPEL